MGARDRRHSALPIALVILLLGMSASSTLYSDDRAELAEEDSPLNTHSGLNFPGSTHGSIYSLTAIGAGYNYTCVVMDTNGMKCWGKGGTGYLGNGGSYTVHEPVAVNMPTYPPTAVEMSGGDGHHTCMIVSNGSFYCWGEDFNGQIGHSHYSCGGWCNSPHGPSTLGGKAALTIVTGIHHTCAIAVDETLYCWGRDDYGQVGDGFPTGGHHTPTHIELPPGRTAVAVNAAVDSSCVILDNGSGMCWGLNTYGQLGIGTNDSKDVPTYMSVLPENRSLVALDMGFGHTCGILDDGLVYCWGNNTQGQFGDGTNNNSLSPRAASLPPGRTAISIDAGTFHTCAILDDSSAYCWGMNTYGQLGDGTTNNSTTPVSVQMPSGLGVAEITTGNKHSCAVATNASVYCWGAHGEGALGLGEGNDSDIPAFVDIGAEYGWHALMSERDNDDDGIVNLFDPFPDGCPVGTYVSGVTCIETDPGWYAVDGEQFACDAGSFQPDSGQVDCIIATPGHFVNTTAATSQTQCQPGYYQPLSNQTSCLQADPGSYSSASASTLQYQCQPGYYQPNHGATGCILADAGHFVVGEGALNQIPCSPGTYQFLSGATSCFEATRGFQVPSAGASAQEACGPGNFSADPGQAQCTDASPGYFVSGSQQTSQSPCQPGQFQPDTGQTSCLTVEQGHYTDAEGTGNQIPCDPGTYQPDTGQTSCIQADPGNYSSLAGATSQSPCSAGTFSSEPGQSNCTQAEPGNYVGLDGATIQTPCPTGEYQEGSGGEGCQQAPPGQVVSADGSSAPSPCPPGKYQSGQGQSSCMEASPGHFVNESGSTEQIPCQPGSYQSDPGQSECVPASPGSHASGEGATGQTPCSKGTFQASEGQDSCTEAMPGHHVPEEGALSQSTCKPGSFQPEGGQEGCSDASPGNFVSGTGSMSEMPCQPGTYQGNQGSTQCQDADSGHYVPEAGAIEQLKCPSGEIQELDGQTACNKPDRPLWLTFLMFAVPAVLGGSLAIMYLAKRKKEEQSSRKRSYMYSEDVRSKR